MFPDPFDVGNNNQNINTPINPATGEPWEQPQQSIEQYPDLVGIQDIELPEDIVYDSIPKGNGINNASGMFNVNQKFELPTPLVAPNAAPDMLEMRSHSQIAREDIDKNIVASGQPSYEDPIVKRTNKLEGGLNRFMDSRGVEAFSNTSKDAVDIAEVINNRYEDKAVWEAEAANRDNLLADNIYGTNEDPFMKRGSWDVNTGTFGSEGQRTVRTNMGIAKQGGETANVDSIILAKLIAAGADIEIL